MASERSQTWPGLKIGNKECTCSFVCGYKPNLFVHAALPNISTKVGTYLFSKKVNSLEWGMLVTETL